MDTKGEGSDSHGPGIGVIEALIATVIGSSLTPAVKMVWERLMSGQLADWAQGSLANLVGALILVPIFYVVTRKAVHRSHPRI